jgi:probable phosphoglycerate mutase
VKTLVLLRHGRTAWNHEGRVQGQHDVGLDDVGLAQAERTAPHVAALAPAVLWCSDLRRTRETAAPLLGATGLAATYDARLREFSFGERETLSHAELREVAPDEALALSRGDYDAIPSAERTSAVRTRMVQVLGELLAATDDGQVAVAVSHGAAIRVATGALLGWPDEQFHTLHGLDNCGFVLLEQHAGLDHLLLRAYNRVAP